MKILNFGSINIDHVYKVEHFVVEGETIKSNSYTSGCGGKGLNQSVALANAGEKVFHAGAVHCNETQILSLMKEKNVDTTYLKQLDSESGHAIIQVTEKGQNCIIIHGGANLKIDADMIDAVLADFSAGDIVVLQNEISNVATIMERAKTKGMRIVLNPSPINDALLQYPLHLADYLILNEIEGAALGCDGGEEVALNALHEKYPNATIVLTIGKNGVMLQNDTETLRHGIYNVPVVDTTAAGDTFSGFFIACIAQGKTNAQALKIASAASSLTVSRPGAAQSIPTMQEVIAFLQSAE